MGTIPFENSLIWAAVLVVAYPVFNLALTEWILRLNRARRPLATPLGYVRNLILPSLAALILLQRVMNWSNEGQTVRIAQTVMWLFVVHTALSFLNVVLFADAKEGSWQSRVPRLFIDMIRVVIVLLCAAIVLSTVWGQDLGNLIGALGIGSLVLGLALQEPLGNLFSGIMLMMERPVAVGDWIRFEDEIGVVIETTWRSVQLRTTSHDMVVVPNSALAQGSFTNFSRPTRIHRESVFISFSCDDPPNKVKRVLIETARRTTDVLDEGIKVRLNEFDQSAIKYEVKLPTVRYDRIKDIVEEFRSLVWYAAKRNHLTMPYPVQTQIVVPKSELDAQASAPLPPEALEAFPRFGLGDGSLAPAVARRAIKHYAKGERIVAEGHVLSGLHLILHGSVALTARNHAGAAVTIANLSRGEFFGESALLSSGQSDVTVTALEDLELLVLDSDWLHALIDRVPNLSREIGDVMEYRRKSLRQARSENGAGRSEAVAP